MQVFLLFIRYFARSPSFSETSFLFFARFITNRITNRGIFEFFLLIYVAENGVSQILSQSIGLVDSFHAPAGGVLTGMGAAVHRGGCLTVPRHGRGNVGIVGQFVNVGNDGVAESAARHALQAHLLEDVVCEFAVPGVCSKEWFSASLQESCRG